MVRRAALLLAAGGAALSLLTSNAAASVGPVRRSPDQAGYEVTGAHFNYAGIWVRLPQASRFAQEVGRLGISVQFWSRSVVADFSILTCTDASCKPGGAPAARKYRLRFALYSRATHALLCSTDSSSPTLRCPHVPRSWNQARLAAGRESNPVLLYSRGESTLDMGLGRYTYTYFPIGTKVNFSQARIVTEYGTDPWSAAEFRAPTHHLHIASFGIPPSPPTAAEISNAPEHAGCVAAKWWTWHRLTMTSVGKIRASPSVLSNSGCNFGVRLRP